MDEREYIEARIKEAVENDVLIDMRSNMPRGRDQHGKLINWPTRRLKDILGQCTHQNVGNDTNPMSPASYHTSRDNHITPGRPLASIVYAAAIRDVPDEPAWLTADPLWRMYSQGKRDADGYPGDENLHLIAFLIMGNFAGPGWRGKEAGPSKSQMLAWDKLTSWSMKTFDYGAEGMFGHYHFGKAACPGYVVMNSIEKARYGALDIVTDLQWQEALLRWRDDCLPKYGPDGDWEGESRTALIMFQKEHRLRVTGQKDPFTELVLLQQYPPAERGDL
jgi:hypothetical protein